MKITFECEMKEFAKCFGEDLSQNAHTKEFEITVGKEVFVCIPRYMNFNGTCYGGTRTVISVDAYSKRERDIVETISLVNQTKEAHKEAQRKLAELQKDKK